MLNTKGRPRNGSEDNILKMALGETMRELRMARGIPCGRFAKSLNISYTRYWKYEYGRQFPTLLTLFKIIHELGCTDGYFFNIVRQKIKDSMEGEGE